MHVLTLVEADPRHFKNFEEWVNTREYGSRTYCREMRLYDINVKEKDLPYLLGDLKHYDKVPAKGKKKYSRFFRFYNFLVKQLGKVLPIEPINMEKVEKTPKKWFNPIPRTKGKKPSGPMKYVPKYVYLKPLGAIKDRKHKGGNERI